MFQGSRSAEGEEGGRGGNGGMFVTIGRGYRSLSERLFRSDASNAVDDAQLCRHTHQGGHANGSDGHHCGGGGGCDTPSHARTSHSETIRNHVKSENLSYNTDEAASCSTRSSGDDLSLGAFHILTWSDVVSKTT